MGLAAEVCRRRAPACAGVTVEGTIPADTAFIAGTLATIGLSFIAPVAARFAVQLSPADYVALMVLAFVGVVLVLATQAVSAAVLLGAHEAIASIYTRDLAVASLAGTLLLYAAALLVFAWIYSIARAHHPLGAIRGLFA